jgi:hypothetical protein
VNFENKWIENVDKNSLDQDRFQWRIVVNMEMKLRVQGEASIRLEAWEEGHIGTIFMSISKEICK